MYTVVKEKDVTMRIYVYLNKNKVFALIPINDENPESGAYKAAFDTGGTKVFDITDQPYADVGWLWNGSTFINPDFIKSGN